MDDQFPRSYNRMPAGAPQQYGPAPAPQAPYNPPKKRGGFFKWLLILILLAAAAAGIYYWQHKKVSDLNAQLKDANNQVNSISDQFAAYKNQVGNATTTGQPTTVAIKELGLQLTVSSDLKDLTYKVISVNYKKPTNNLGTYPTAFLSTKALDGLESGKCAATNFKTDSVPPLGYLTKTTGTYPASPTADNSTGTLVKQFSGYYIAWRAPASDCFATVKNNDTAKALRNELSAELIPVSEKQ